jgi:hypothetical protein
MEGWPTNWQILAKDLQSIMVEHRDIGHSWAFGLDPTDALSDYLATTHLLVECLKLAYVTDRTAIEERLLLPPGRKDNG